MEDHDVFICLYVLNQKVSAFVKQWFLPPICNKYGSSLESGFKIALFLSSGINNTNTPTHCFCKWCALVLFLLHLKEKSQKKAGCNSKLNSWHISLGQVEEHCPVGQSPWVPPVIVMRLITKATLCNEKPYAGGMT